MPNDFKYEVFLSHSAKDKPVVRELANRLKKDKLRVWFDESDSLSPRERAGVRKEALENSRLLVLCMSANAFGSEWVQLEAGTFRFRDPLNQERRFIPLRLDEAPIKGSLTQFLYIDWLLQDREQEYAKLLEACQQPAKPSVPEAQATSTKVAEKAIQLDYKDADIFAYAFSPDGKRALTGADDSTVRLQDLTTGRCLRVLEGHKHMLYCAVWSTDQRRIISCSADKTIRLWDVETGHCLRVLEGHKDTVKPGDVVKVDFPGALGIKRRPAVVVSTDVYHTNRPDVVLGLLTTQIAGATGPTDYILQDWPAAGLHNPSAFRVFLATLPTTSVIVIGHLSDRDWQEAQARLQAALAV